MRNILKQIFSFALRLGVSAALLWLVFFYIDDKEKIVVLVREADIRYLIAAFIFFLAVHCALIIRWRIFIKAFDLDVSWMKMVRYFFLGLFGNLFLPTAIGGDVIKAAGLCADSQQKQKVVASVLLDRLSGFASMVIVSGLSFIIGFPYLKHSGLWLPVVLMGVLFAGIGAVLFSERLYRFFCQVFYFFPKIRSAVMQMHYDIVLLKDRKGAILQAIGVACIGQLILALTFFLLTRGLKQDISVFYFIIFTPLACVASSFPSIGGLGFREGVLEYLLLAVGTIAGIGLSIGLLNFFFMVIVGVCGGIFFIMTKNITGITVSTDRS